MYRFTHTIFICALLVASMMPAAFGVEIETVPVGDPGNAVDTRYGGYGAVGYTYRIGKYEVTAGQYAEFLNAVARTDTYGLYNPNMGSSPLGCGIQRSGSPDAYTYSVPSDWADHPVDYVSFWDACRFTNWLSNGQPRGLQVAGTTERGTYKLDGYTGTDGRSIKRSTDWKWGIANENEWYKAAYYKAGSENAGYWDYPTRSNTAPGRDIRDLSGNNANYYSPGGFYPIDWPKYTTTVGQFHDSASPYGTFDQGGNLHEWNETVFYQDATVARRGLRGGGFNYYSHFLGAFSRDVGSGNPSAEGSAGFRVVQVPEPPAMAVFGFAGLAVLRRLSP